MIVTIGNYRSSGRDLATWHRSAEKLNYFLSPKNQLSDDGQRFFHRETGTKGVIRMMMIASIMKMMTTMKKMLTTMRKMMTTLLMMLAIVAKMTDAKGKCWRKYDDTPKEQEKSEAKDFPNLFGFCWRITGGMDLD